VLGFTPTLDQVRVATKINKNELKARKLLPWKWRGSFYKKKI
jgi:hypothetical protein